MLIELRESTSGSAIFFISFQNLYILSTHSPLFSMLVEWICLDHVMCVSQVSKQIELNRVKAALDFGEALPILICIFFYFC